MRVRRDGRREEESGVIRIRDRNKDPASVRFCRVLRTACDLRARQWQGQHTGLRISDAVMLKWSDLDLDRMMIRQLKLKKTRDTSSVSLDIPIVSGLAREFK